MYLIKAVKVLFKCYFMLAIAFTYIENQVTIKGLVYFQNKNVLILYSPSCQPRCLCLSFFSRKEIKVFKENISEFFLI